LPITIYKSINTIVQNSRNLLSGNTVVKRHRKKRQSNISAYFFGEDKSRSLSSEDFTKFQEELQKDILKMEYNLLERGDNDIAKMKDFGLMLIEHARMDPDKTKKIRKRLNKFYKKKKATYRRPLFFYIFFFR